MITNHCCKKVQGEPLRYNWLLKEVSQTLSKSLENFW